jgi:TRAP-type uncharacterized transport system fused permease subunit
VLRYFSFIIAFESIRNQAAFSKAVLIAVAYASSIGGISTLTGTGTNLVFAGQVYFIFLVFRFEVVNLPCL